MGGLSVTIPFTLENPFKETYVFVSGMHYVDQNSRLFIIRFYDIWLLQECYGEPSTSNTEFEAMTMKNEVREFNCIRFL